MPERKCRQLPILGKAAAFHKKNEETRIQSSQKPSNFESGKKQIRHTCFRKSNEIMSMEVR